ncbi:MAG: DUF397 domain-containing protein [Nocardia sp.]|nr:DUF397 domain-containing protein [Nocardia sp.]
MPSYGRYEHPYQHHDTNPAVHCRLSRELESRAPLYHPRFPSEQPRVRRRAAGDLHRNYDRGNVFGGGCGCEPLSRHPPVPAERCIARTTIERPAPAGGEEIRTVSDGDLSCAEWFKSSHSGRTGECVEVSWLGKEQVGVRDSKTPDGPALVFGPEAWSAFTDGLRRGELDTD